MITTPISDYIDGYLSHKGVVRAHMPGHKGVIPGMSRDITEIDGADCLFDPKGIILESEKNASRLFGSKATFYSTEGSSLSIRAALYLAMRMNPDKKEHTVVALRNVHKSFISAASLLGFEIRWVYGTGSLLDREFSLDEIAAALAAGMEPPDCIYVTSPDYLGRIRDISGLAGLAHKYGSLLVVDNAHGAYLKFIAPDTHPLTLGADIVCDSAHKTLPVLTGGAYLHLGHSVPDEVIKTAPGAMELFGSTSPSWPVLESLDCASRFLSENSGSIKRAADRIEQLGESLRECGWDVLPSDPFRITVKTKSFGYIGAHVAGILKNEGIIVEFADRDHVVLMLTGFNTESDFHRIENAFGTLRRQDPVDEDPPEIGPPVIAMTPREALFARSETVSAEMASGRVFLGCALSCPPAVPLIVAGEVTGPDTVRAFSYYGIKEVEVSPLKNPEL
ncbi:MAG: aminotransferase class I/II-fold pyridoxal phosphate-dependent enzyme [Clostridia bacterium]|nr:aminotransferase class I/II-fold pyridoxal phosphate-dependent enzyme [Clostridia bacterium]